MPYRNKTYVCLDYDNDKDFYNIMKAWKDNDNFEFNFYDARDVRTINPESKEASIKAGLRERMINSKVLVVLIGEKTRFYSPYIGWEIELANRLGLPIIAVNINKKRIYDFDLTPSVLDPLLAVHIPFSPAAMTHALDKWPAEHAELARKGETGPRQYGDTVYRSIGVI